MSRCEIIMSVVAVILTTLTLANIWMLKDLWEAVEKWTKDEGKRIIYLPNAVYGDGPFANTVALSGNHIAHVNKHGAVSVVAKDGTLLGVKPDEFQWVHGEVK